MGSVAKRSCLGIHTNNGLISVDKERPRHSPLFGAKIEYCAKLMARILTNRAIIGIFMARFVKIRAIDLAQYSIFAPNIGE